MPERKKKFKDACEVFEEYLDDNQLKRRLLEDAEFEPALETGDELAESLMEVFHKKLKSGKRRSRR